MAASTSSVVLNDVRKSFGAVDVIKGVSLTIEPGEFCVFVGRRAAASPRFCV